MVARMFQHMAFAASSGPTLWDFITPLHGLTGTMKAGSQVFNDTTWVLPFLFRVLWFLFIIPDLIAFVDALRRPEDRYAGSQGFSKTMWVIALAAGVVFPISWIVVPLYFFLVFLPGRRNPAGIPTAKTPSTSPPSRPFK
jgi:hypothetical protein